VGRKRRSDLDGLFATVSQTNVASEMLKSYLKRFGPVVMIIDNQNSERVWSLHSIHFHCRVHLCYWRPRVPSMTRMPDKNVSGCAKVAHGRLSSRSRAGDGPLAIAATA